MAGKASFNWIDPLLLDQQLTEEERMVRDSAEQFAQEKSTQAQFTELDRTYLLAYTHSENDQIPPLRLQLAGDGTVTLLTGKVDIGQGSRTLLTQCVAEELRIPPSKVSVVMGER